MKKRKTIQEVEPIINQTLRIVIRDCDFSILQLAEKACVNRSSLQNFYLGKKDISGKSMSKVFEVLPDESKKQFSTLILEPFKVKGEDKN